MPRIGELLVAGGVLSEVAVQSALGFQRHTGEPFRLGTILLDRDLLGEESLLRALSAIHRCDYVTWPEILKASPQVVRLLPERVALRLAAVPYALEGRGVRVAFKNPSNLAAVDEVSAVTNRPVIPGVISEVRLLQAFNLFHGRPIPIEFRSVLLKLERNEERRHHRARATPRLPVPGRSAQPRGVEAAREIPIAIGGSDAAPPSAYAAPFAAADLPHGTLADAADFLPDFTPPRVLTPEELAERMWKDEMPAGAPENAPVPAVWSLPRPAPEPAAHEEERAAGRDEIAEATLESLAGRFPRSLLLVSAQEAIQGWTGRGGGLTGPRVAAIRIPWGEPSIFAFVKLSGTPHRGPLSRILMPGALTDLLGDRAAASCAVFPVRIKDRLVAFLYADRLGAPLSDQDYKSLEVAASSLGSSLARLLLDLRKAAPAG
jgi:hypothetical protein